MNYKVGGIVNVKQTTHKKGVPFTQPLLCILPRYFVPAEEIDVVETALVSHIGVGQTAALVETRTGVNLDWHQVHYMNTKQRNALLSSDGHSTSADKLETYLLQSGISSVCLYAEYSSNLLSIKQKARSPNSTSTVVSNFEDDLGDDTETPMMFATALEGTVRDNLTNTATGLILLLALWTTDTARRKLDMFPEFVGVDDTEGTNVEERPLHDWCGKDSNNEIQRKGGCK